FVLLVCVTLLAGSLVRLLRVDPGFDPRGVLVLKVSVPSATYGSDRVVAFYSTLQKILEDRLGSGSVAIVNEIPLSGSAPRTFVGLRPADRRTEAVVREASPAYFDVLRIRIVSGRQFETHDDASAPTRAIISESLARGLFGSEPAVGRQ